MAMTLHDQILQDIQKNMKAADFEKIRERSHYMALLGSATLYQLFIINKDKDKGMSKHEFWSVENAVKWELPLFPHARVLIAKSNTKGCDARREKIKVNGRFRTCVFGTWAPPHVHICAIGTEGKSARDFIHSLNRSLAGRGFQSRVKSISDMDHKINHLDYCRRQAESFRQYGNKSFDFKKCLSVKKINIFQPRN